VRRGSEKRKQKEMNEKQMNNEALKIIAGLTRKQYVNRRNVQKKGC
jgi:hypothetical protein